MGVSRGKWRRSRVETRGRVRSVMRGGCSRWRRSSSWVESWGGEDGGAVVGVGGAAGAGLLQVGVGGAVEVRGSRRSGNRGGGGGAG